MRVLFAAADSIELETKDGDRVQLFGPSSRYFERARRPFLRFRADDHDGPRVARHDLFGRLQAVHVGHHDVHRDHVRLERLRQGHRFAAVLRVPHHM